MPDEPVAIQHLSSRAGARIGINAQKLSTTESYRAAGTSRYVFNLLRELRAMDTPERFVAYLGESEIPPSLGPTARFAPRASRLPTGSATLRILWEQLRLPHLLRHDEITLFHGAVNALPLSWRGPSVVTILDLTFLRMPEAFGRANRTYLRSMVRLASRRADRVITISEATRKDVIRLLGTPPGRVVTVHCGVDARFTPTEDAGAIALLRERYNLPQEFILYLGTIEPRKNLVRLIDAYTELRERGLTDWPLVLAGGRGWGEEAILERAALSDASQSIRFVGFVPEGEIPLWYNAAALFVYPSEYEGFGLPVLEALACGTPAIASNSSSLPEVAGNAAVLVDPTDVDAIADGMQRLIEDPSLRSHLATEGPQRARFFSWARMAEQTLGVYRSVLENSWA